MKATLVFLAVFGMLVGNLFAGDTNYREFVLRDVTPGGDPLPVYNCEGDEDGGPFMLTMHFTIGNPFGVLADAKVYAYNPNTQEWALQKTCTNIDPTGEKCDVFIPLVWGMSGNDTQPLGLVKIEMSKGSDVYSKVFTFNTFHSETTQESLIWERISNLSGTIQELKRGAYCTSDSSVCCPVNAKITEFDGVGQRSIELGKECKLRDARQNVMDAINNITALKQEAAACSAAIGQLNSAEGLKASCNDASLAAEVSGLEGKVKSGDYSITAAAAQAIYANTCKGAPAVTTGGTAGTGTEATSATAATGAAATGTGSAPAGTGSTSTTGAAGTASSGSGCPVGFLLLAAAAFAFATREE